MEDDIISSTPEQSQSPKETDVDAAENIPDNDSPGDRVFDITADLNIAPAKDEPSAEPIPPIASQLRTDPQPTVAPRPTPVATPAPTPVSVPTPPRPVPPPITQVPKNPIEPTQPNSFAAPKPPISIPLSDFTKPLQKATAAPKTPSTIGIGAKTNPIVPQNPISQTPIPPASPNKEEFFPKDTDLKALRTYESDVAEVLAHTRTSTASIALAEAKKQEGEDRIKNNDEPQESSRAGVKILLLVLSIVLVLGGVGGAYYFYSKSDLAPKTPATQQTQTVVSLVPSDKQDVISIDGLSTPAILARIQAEFNKPTSPGSITEVIPAETTGGQQTRVTAQDMLSAMEITPPDILTRSLNPYWMLGIYTDTNNTKSGFVVVSSNFFQNAFAGMLQWESVMADDLKQYLTSGNASDIANVIPVPVATSSLGMASSTLSSTTEAIPVQEAPSYNTITGHFEDRIIMNKDVRVFVTSTGQTLFLYSFIDNSRLVVAANENTLKEILTRLENQSFIR